MESEKWIILGKQGLLHKWVQFYYFKYEFESLAAMRSGSAGTEIICADKTRKFH